MDKPVLGYIKNKEIIGVKSLSQKEYLRFEKSCIEIKRYKQSQELFSVTLLNYDDFTNRLNEYYKILSKSQGIGMNDLDKMIFDLNRKILNYLSSIRTFLDHNETNIKRSNSDENVKYFKEVCAEHYDNSFAYRFLYKLRNYVQHCGMPVGNLLINSQKNVTGDKGIKVEISLLFNRDKLLIEDDVWNSQLRKEISELPQYFDIPTLLHEMMTRLGDIHLSLLEKLFPTIKLETENIINLSKEISVDDSRPIVFNFSETTENNSNLTFKELPLQLINCIHEDIERFNA